jgi:hypothetical protein
MRVQDLAPASVRVKEAPPHAVLSHKLHAPTSVQESREHALSELNNSRIFLGLCRLCRVVRKRMLLGNGWNDQSWVECYKCRP